MPRIRTLKPEHRQHRKLGPLDHLTYRLWVGMILEADDAGRLVYDPDQLRALIFAYHPKVSRAIVEASASCLESVGLIRRYVSDGQIYAWFPSWLDHQRLDHPTPSKLPPPNDSLIPREDSGSPPRVLAKTLVGSDLDLDLDLEGKGKEGSGGACAPTNGVAFRIPAAFTAALDRAPTLGAVSRLRHAPYWQAEIRANPLVDHAAEILRAEAWLVANPRRANKKDLARFVHNWLSRAEPAAAED